MISDDKIAEIRQAARISEFVTPHVGLKRRGRSLLGLCPFHNEKTPSFSVDDERGFYHCFGCSAGGNVFKFVMEMERLTFPEAVRKVAERYGIAVPEVAGQVERRDPSSYEINASAANYYRRFLVESEHGQRFRDYLAGRGVGEAAAEQYAIGAASPSGTGLARWLAREGVDLRKAEALGLLVERGGAAYDRFRDRLMFPIRDPQGRVIGFGGRQIEAGTDGPKYLNSPESEVYQKSRVLYGLYEARDALRHESAVLLVEGYLDVIALHEAGIRNVVATCGTALTAEQARTMRRYVSEVVTLFDGDAAGKRAAARAFPIFIEAGIWARGLTLPDGEDPDTFVRKAGADAMRERFKTAVPLTEAFVEHTVSSTGKDPASLARAGADLANVLAKVTDPFEHDVLVRKAALWTGISEDVLRRESSRGKARTHERQVEAPARAATNIGTQRGGAAGPAETLASLLLADRDLLPLVAKRAIVDRMEESIWTDLTRDMLATAEDGRSFDPADALDRLPDQLRARVAARLMDDSLGDRARRERMIEDCMRSIERAAERRHTRDVIGAVRKTEQLNAGEIPHEMLRNLRPRNSSDG